MTAQRRPLVAGNWKMNTSLAEAVTLAGAISAHQVEGVDVVVCPPFPWLVTVRELLAGTHVAVGGQDCWPKANGAYTGGTSLAMLSETCSYVIVGHSERRQYWHESDELIREKISAVLDAGLTPVFCVGESLETRQSGDAEEWVTRQVLAGLGNRPAEEVDATVIAYEPIWAIGTGVAASADDAESMAATIRNAVESINPGSGAAVRVLYGGSVTAANAQETLSQPNVDGALVGGASLKADAFLTIVAAARN